MVMGWLVGRVGGHWVIGRLINQSVGWLIAWSCLTWDVLFLAWCLVLRHMYRDLFCNDDKMHKVSCHGNGRLTRRARFSSTISTSHLSYVAIRPLL